MKASSTQELIQSSCLPSNQSEKTLLWTCKSHKWCMKTHKSYCSHQVHY